MKISATSIAEQQCCLACLSPRERQVFLAIACGDPPQVTAKRCNISVKTIATYRTRVMEKLGLSSNQQCTAYAMANHLLCVVIDAPAISIKSEAA